MTPEEIDRRHEERIRVLDAGQRNLSLTGRLAVAVAELEALSERAKAAYRCYVALDHQQTAKGAEVRELRLQIREAAAQGVPRPGPRGLSPHA